MDKKYMCLLGFLFFVVISNADACIPNWYQDPITCSVYDNYTITYSDLNNCNSTNAPYNNGTVAYCNYCNEDLQMVSGACVNQSQNISWTDNNYFTCCSVTSLPSDCSILVSPFNSSYSQVCYWDNLTYEMGNLTCQREPNIGVNDKEYCIAHIPLNYSNESFKCIALIRDGNTDEIVQTTPEYREVSQTFFNWRPDADTRQYFTPANTIVNFYYTGKNLHPDKDYILTIECSSAQRTLKSEMNFQIAYGDVSFVFFRTRWLMGNAPYIIGGVILLFIILAVLILVVRYVI